VLEHTYDHVDHVSCHAYDQELDGNLGCFLASATDTDCFIDTVVATADEDRAAVFLVNRALLQATEPPGRLRPRLTLPTGRRHHGPARLPEKTTWYLATNRPHPDAPHATTSPHSLADLAEIVRLNGPGWPVQRVNLMSG